MGLSVSAFGYSREAEVGKLTGMPGRARSTSMRAKLKTYVLSHPAPTKASPRVVRGQSTAVQIRHHQRGERVATRVRVWS